MWWRCCAERWGGGVEWAGEGRRVRGARGGEVARRGEEVRRTQRERVQSGRGAWCMCVACGAAGGVCRVMAWEDVGGKAAGGVRVRWRCSSVLRAGDMSVMCVVGCGGEGIYGSVPTMVHSQCVW